MPIKTTLLSSASLAAFMLSGCLANEQSKSSNSTQPNSELPKPPASSIETTTVPRSGLIFYDENWGPVDGSENIIKACTTDQSYCFSTCISVFFPEHVRYSLFRTDFLLGNKCAASLLAYPDDSGLAPPFYYW